MLLSRGKMDASSSNAAIYRSKDKQTHWSLLPSADTLNELPTLFQGSAKVKGKAESAKTAEECFQLFITPDMITRMTKLTNSKIDQITTTTRDEIMPTDESEMKAFLGILILSGLYLYENLRELWDAGGFGVDIFRATISATRFLNLLKCFQFTPEENLTDVLKFMDEFNTNCQDNMELSSYVTLEEQSLAYRGECPIRYTTRKKVGIRLMSVRDARLNYTHGIAVHRLDKDKNEVVAKLTAPLQGPDRLIVADKRFTSASLVDQFTLSQSFFLGQIKNNSPELPPEFAAGMVTSDGPTVCLYSNRMTLISHTLKNDDTVFLLSNLQSVKSALNDVLVTYDALACQIDVVDAMCRTYSCSKRTNRWDMHILFRLIDIACINAQIIFTINDANETLTRRNFLKKMAVEMAKPYLIARSRMTTLPTAVRESAAKIANVSMVCGLTDHAEMIPQGRAIKNKRCTACPKTIDCKSPYYCQGCKRFICRKRSYLFCKECITFSTDKS